MSHVQISATPPRIQYVADGSQTSFTYPFAIFEDDDIEVYLGDALQMSGYGVAGAGESAGGLVTLAVAPVAGTLVTLRRNIAIERVSDFQEGGALRAKVLNDELDRLTACLQQVAGGLGRSLVLSPVDPADNLVLPGLAARASAILGFDAAGAPLAYPASAFKGDKGDKGEAGERGADGMGTGDVLGPATAGDGHVALFDGATGKRIKSAGAALSSKADVGHDHSGVYANASHAHGSSDVADFVEAAQDVVGAMVAAAGGGYDDGAGTLAFPVTGAWEFVATATPSSGTVYDFTGFAAGYDYLVTGSAIGPASGAWRMTYSCGHGVEPTFASSYHDCNYWNYSSSGPACYGEGSATKFDPCAGSNTAGKVNFSILIHNVGSSGEKPVEISNWRHWSGGTTATQLGLGSFRYAGPCTGLRLDSNGGGFSGNTGQFAVWRRKRSA